MNLGLGRSIGFDQDSETQNSSNRSNISMLKVYSRRGPQRRESVGFTCAMGGGDTKKEKS